MANLFESIQLGSLVLTNRVLMAPLTRNRADADGVPSELGGDLLLAARFCRPHRDRGDAGFFAATTCAIATSADSRAHPLGSLLRASWCRLPQAVAETRVPRVLRPSPKHQVA